MMGRREDFAEVFLIVCCPVSCSGRGEELRAAEDSVKKSPSAVTKATLGTLTSNQ